MYVATNGNIKSATDPDFIHFPDEQTGILLPNIPGYPAWLPNLQLTPTGRLCFWNFPNAVYKSVVSNPANIGTSQFLRDAKKVTASNQYPPVPADKLGTNGATNQYFWNSCNTYFILDATLNQILLENLLVHLAPMNPGKSADQILSGGVNPFPPVGNKLQLEPWYWIQANAQYYINRYLKNPYSLDDETPYTLNWITQFNKASQTGDLQKWLTAFNFLIEPTGSPDFWTKTLTALPTVILGIVAGAVGILSFGAATPALVAALSAMGGLGKAAQAAQGKLIVDEQTAAANRVINTGQVTTDVQTLTGNTPTTAGEKTFLFIAGAALIILIIILFYKSKK